MESGRKGRSSVAESLTHLGYHLLGVSERKALPFLPEKLECHRIRTMQTIGDCVFGTCSQIVFKYGNLDNDAFFSLRILAVDEPPKPGFSKGTLHDKNWVYPRNGPNVVGRVAQLANDF